MRGRVVLVLSLLLAPSLVGVAGADAGEQQILVALDTWPAPESLETLLEARGVEIVERFDAAETLLVEAPAGSDGTLSALPGVAYVVPDEPIDANLASSKAAVRLTGPMQEAGLTGEGVNIALIDSGVDPDHPGLEDRLQRQLEVGEDGVEEGTSSVSQHGTHVAGILVGTGEGAASAREDVSGVAPGAGLVSLDISEQFTTSNALRAFEWLYEHHDEEDIQVLANAWGRQRDPAAYEPDDPIVRASDALVEEGVVVVFSAGNGGPEASHMTVEGTNPNVITVGAADDDGEVESYSSRGPIYEDGEQADWTKPDLVAPGSRIVSTRAEPGARSAYVMMNGTSMAAPHGAGAAALLVSLRQDLTPSQVKGLLVESAADVGPAGVDDASGAGMLDVSAAVERLERAGSQVVERSATTSGQGELTGPKEGGAVLETASIDHADSLDVEVPANATELEATVTWEGRSDLEVRIVDPSGRTLRSALVSDEHTLSVPDPREGAWRVEVEPSGATRGTYQADVTTTWLVHQAGTEIPIAEQRTRSGAFPSTGNPLDPFSSAWIPGVPNLVPMLAGGVLTAVMVVGKLKRSGTSSVDPPDEPGRA